MTTYAPILFVGALTLLTAGAQHLGAEAQGQPPGSGRPGGAPAAAPAPDPNKPAQLEITTGTKARYRVREQLAGISFPSDAVGSTESVTGTIIVNPDGTIDGAASKITVDLRTITSDQQMRDGYVQRLTLETEKHPFLEFVPRRAVGLPVPFPSAPPAQAGFQLIGDMTLHGVTSEATWNVVATFAPNQVSGRATTTLLFTTYKMAKPTLARLLSVDDTIELEVEFRTNRSAR
jgi:polyisoprenoid-binding protein YceI